MKSLMFEKVHFPRPVFSPSPGGEALAYSKIWVAVLLGMVWASMIPFGSGCMGPPDDLQAEQVQQAYWTASPGPDTVDGIDVSHWQGTIDWQAVADDGIVFAFIRVSDGDPAGSGVADSDFDANWAHAKDAGLIIGAYQFFRPNQNVDAQADYLIDKLGGTLEPGQLPPVIDVEVDGGLPPSQVVSAIQRWLDRVEAAFGVKPIIYTSASLWSEYTANSMAFGGYPLWVAHYTSPSGPFRVPDGWSDWRFWQYSSSGHVSGISSNSVDLNFFNGDLAALRAFTVGDPVCGDGYCTGDEDHTSCPQDCPVCENVPSQGRIVDETDLCFESGGDPRWWRHVQDAGWDSSLMWTHTVGSPDQMDNFGIWHLTFDQAGEYRVEAYTDAAYAQSKQARYQVRHDGTEETMVVDQSAQDGWALVGEFSFAAGADQWVRLEDYTGEPLSDDVQIVFDALRLTRLDQPEEDAGPGDDATMEIDGALETPDGGEDQGDAGAPDGGHVRRTAEGCDCRSVGSEPGSMAWWWLLVVAGLTRRRSGKPRS